VSLVLGLGGPYHHDGSACLIDSTGTILAFAEEERFTRRKHNKDSRSCAMSALYCLTTAGAQLGDLDEVAVAWNPRWPDDIQYIDDADLIRELLDPAYFGGYAPPRLTVIDHHVAHAASAFYPSGFDESVVLVADGSGDGISTSTFHGTAAGLDVIEQYPYTASLGWFYETVAEHLGLGDWTSAGKLMGLAAYGKPSYHLDFLITEPDGYRLDLAKYGLHQASPSTDDYTTLDYYWRLKRAYAAAYTRLGVPPHRRSRRYDPATGRFIDDTSFTTEQANLAATVQSRLESCLIAVVSNALNETGSNNLCIAGGVGLNCTANGHLRRALDLGGRLFVQPAAGDAGCAIGAALECARRRGRLSLPTARLTDAALGPAFTDQAIRKTLDTHNVRYSYHSNRIAEPIAVALAGGAMAGWFQGRQEAGPRALGHRSILADPRRTTMRDRINANVKRREPWRPLAPSILASATDMLIADAGPAEFMIVAYEATDAARETIPATIHVDGTIRPQVVSQQTDPGYHRLLSEFEAMTGTPALLNTSFNTDTEPIVCTPTDALRTFFASPLDVLALGGFLIDKRQ
jgi:carbamoyltransferase